MNRLMLSALAVAVLAISPAAFAGDIRQLYEYPRDTAYDNLGVIDVEHYRIGLREPTLADAMPKITAKVQELGGDAFIVRHQKVYNLSSRRIAVTAEVLRLAPAEPPQTAQAD